MAAQNVPFVFTDSHAYCSWANYYTDLTDLNHIDWPILQLRDFRRDRDDLAKFERYQAEALNWPDVRARIESVLGSLQDVEILIYEPTEKYQNVAKSTGVKKLTPARAMIAELVRRYSVLGMECSLLEIHKLAWLLQRAIEQHQQENVLKLQFEAHYYGPYAPNLNHLLNALDGTYLKAEKRIPDSQPLDVIWFNDREQGYVNDWFNSEAKEWLPVLEQVSQLIDGFESPFGLELLATVDWLLSRGGCQPTLDSVKEGLRQWPAGERWASRKIKLFSDNNLQFAIDRVMTFH